MKNSVDGLVLNTKEAAKLLRVSQSAMKNYVRNGSIKAFTTPGGHYRIFKKDLDAFIELQKSRGNKRRILVVDDDQSTIDVLRVTLESEGYEVITASSAVKLGIKAISETPDLILLDLMMPGIDGYDACYNLKSEPDTAHIPVILITGVDLRAVVHNYTKVKADAYILKPFDFREVIKKVNELIDKKSA